MPMALELAWIHVQSGASSAPGFTAGAAPNTPSLEFPPPKSVSPSRLDPTQRTARRYFETAPDRQPKGSRERPDA